MGDRAPATLMIYACPPEHEERVIGLLCEHGFTDEWFSSADPEPPVRLADAYVVDEVSLGICTDLGSDLAALNVTFEIHQDPKYEWDGDYFANVPDLGTFGGSCDPDGNVHLAGHDIDTIIEANQTREALVEALNAATGKLWRMPSLSSTGRPRKRTDRNRNRLLGRPQDARGDRDREPSTTRTGPHSLTSPTAWAERGVL